MSDGLIFQKQRLTDKLKSIEAGELTFTDEGKKAACIQRTKKFLAEVEAALKQEAKK